MERSGILHCELKEANALGKWTDEVSAQVRNLNENDELETRPAGGGQELVDQSLFGVDAEVFVPDDAVQQQDDDGDDDDGEGEAEIFGRIAAEQTVERINRRICFVHL